MNCTSLLTAWVAQSDGRPALIFVDSKGDTWNCSWRRIASDVAVTLKAIDQAGMVPGDRMVHAFGNTLKGVITAIASMIAGTIEVPLDPSANSQSHQFHRQFVDGRWFDSPLQDSPSQVGEDPCLSWLADRERQHPANHPAIILFTSGSTGYPKGVTLSRSNLFTNAAAKLRAAPQLSSDVRLTVLPLWHAYARTCDLMTWLLSGCTLAVTQGWDGCQFLAPIVQPSLINTVPSFASRLYSQASDWPGAGNLRMLGCGGAAMTHDSFARWVDRGVTVIQGYGLTEASPVVCSATPKNSRPGYVGQPVVGCETRIGEQGQLEVRGAGVMLGYWNDSVATHEKVKDGWLDTGDCVEEDQVDKQFRVLGRIDDRITLSNGLKFFPGSIEQRVSGLQGISHAILVPNDRHVELFIDIGPSGRPLDQYVVEIERALADFPSWQLPRHIYSMSRSFADIPHATTAKGNLCRPVAIEACSQARAIASRALSFKR